MDGDGNITLLGRLKEIINAGGEKISPFEIEEALLSHPAVAGAIAFAVPCRKLGEKPAAAVVLKEGCDAASEELLAFVADRLSGFKVPDRLLQLPEIPKGPTGKPQRIGMAARLGLDRME
jgi:acyl-coenzyme A synthetase/AMP-(fatty) acid ligase